MTQACTVATVLRHSLVRMIEVTWHWVHILGASYVKSPLNFTCTCTTVGENIQKENLPKCSYFMFDETEYSKTYPEWKAIG